MLLTVHHLPKFGLFPLPGYSTTPRDQRIFKLNLIAEHFELHLVPLAMEYTHWTQKEIEAVQKNPISSCSNSSCFSISIPSFAYHTHPHTDSYRHPISFGAALHELMVLITSHKMKLWTTLEIFKNIMRILRD